MSADDSDHVWFESYDKISYGEVRTLIDENKIEAARVLNDGWWVTVKTKEGKFFDARVTPQTPIADHLYAAGIPVQIEHWNEDDEDERPLWEEVLINMLPLLVFLIFFGVLLFTLSRGNNGYYERAEKLQHDFFETLEKLLLEQRK